MVRKGLSAEEKRNRILNYMLEKKEPFKKDEVIKFCKILGINNRDIAEKVLMELVGDSLVTKETIGNSNFFWAFPIDLQRALDTQMNAQDQKIDKLKEAKVNSLKEIEDAKIGREESEERTKNLEYLKSLNAKIKPLQQELNRLKTNSPENYEDLQGQNKLLKMKCNHWLDQVSVAEFHLRRKMYWSSKQIQFFFCGLLEDETFKIENLEEYTFK